MEERERERDRDARIQEADEIKDRGPVQLQLPFAKPQGFLGVALKTASSSSSSPLIHPHISLPSTLQFISDTHID